MRALKFRDVFAGYLRPLVALFIASEQSAERTERGTERFAQAVALVCCLVRGRILDLGRVKVYSPGADCMPGGKTKIPNENHRDETGGKGFSSHEIPPEILFIGTLNHKE